MGFVIPTTDLSKLASFWILFIGHDDACGGGLAGNHRMRDLIVRQGPEGRGQTSAQPGRAGVSMGMNPSAVGAVLAFVP
jgi:hypothetical protein